MFNWVYRIADGVLLQGGPCDVTAGAGQAVASLPRNPKPRLERWDVEHAALRPATVEEIDAYDLAEMRQRTSDELDANKDLKAVVIFFADHLGLNRQETRDAILALRRLL